MKRILSLLALLAVVGIFAAPLTADASIGTAQALRDQRRSKDAFPGASWTITLAQNVIDTTVVAVTSYVRPFAGLATSSTSALYTAISLASDLSAATDSVNIGIDVGPTSTGPWTQAIAQTNATYTLTTAAPVIGRAVLSSTMPVMPYMRFRTKARGSATLTGKTIWAYFPSVSFITN